MKLQLSRNHGLRFIGFFAAGFAMSLWSRSAPAPELSVDHTYAIPAFAIFILFFAAIVSAGALVRARILASATEIESWLFDLSVGSCLFYLLSYALTPLTLFSSAHCAIAWLILAGFFSLGSPHWRFPRFDYKSFPTWYRVLIALPLVIVALRLLEGLQIAQHGDGYITYLPGPRSWAVAGNFKQYLIHTQFFLSTSFESLYAWGTVLMGLQGGQGLDLSQWFSQWTTAGVGVLGLVVALGAFGNRLAAKLRLSGAVVAVATTLSVQLPALRWTANLAKNDLGVAFWGVALFYFAQFWMGSSSLLFLAGVLAGTMVIGKLTSVIFGICVSVLILYRARGRFGFYFLGGLLGVTPILIRNGLLTGNPMFPWLSDVFGTSHLLGLSESSGTAHATGLALGFDSVGTYLKEWVKEVPLSLLLIPVLFLRNRWPQLRSAVILPAVAAIAFTLLLRPATEIRYQGPALILLSFFGCLFAFHLIPPGRYARHFKAVLALALIVNSNISFYSLAQLRAEKYQAWNPRAAQMPETGGPAKLWIRSHLPNTDRILIMGDGYIYYLLDYSVTQYSRVEGLEKSVAAGDIEKLSQALRAAPFDHLYLNREADFDQYRPTMSRLMDHLIANPKVWRPECLKFQDGTAQIWDLKCL